MLLTFQTEDPGNDRKDVGDATGDVRCELTYIQKAHASCTHDGEA